MILFANLKQLKSKLNLVDSDNIKLFDHLMKNKGKIFSLDLRSYIEFLNDINVFYTVSPE